MICVRNDLNHLSNLKRVNIMHLNAIWYLSLYEERKGGYVNVWA